MLFCILQRTIVMIAFIQNHVSLILWDKNKTLSKEKL